MTSKQTVKAVQTNKNHWYRNAAKGKVGPVLPKAKKS